MQGGNIRGNSAVIQDEYIESIKEHLIEVAYEWASGNTFANICKMT